jgi:proteasome lid subunit RPN8/RPN11
VTLLTASLVARLERLLAGERRREIVAYVLGAEGREPELVSVRNWGEQAGCFSVAAGEVERVARHAERRGLDVQALVHSHRSSLDLSAADAAEMRAGVIPWIVVTSSPDGLRYRTHPCDEATAA